DRRRRRIFGGQAVLRLRPRQRIDVPAVGGSERRVDGRTAAADGGLQANGRRAADGVLRRADAVCGDARRGRPARSAAGGAAARWGGGGRGGRQAVEVV